MMELTVSSPARRFLSEYWNESGDIYLNSFEEALELFRKSMSGKEEAVFLEELHRLASSGLLGDVDSSEGFKFWDSLGGRALTEQEYRSAVKALTKRQP